MPVLVRELGHRILTPVHVISMQVQTLMAKELKSEEVSNLPEESIAKIKQRMNVISKNAESIAKVCNYLRDVSKEIPAVEKQFDLVEILDTCIEEHLSELDDKKIRWAFFDKPAGSVIIEADPWLIKYSLQCVMDNAIEAIQQRRERETAEDKSEESIEEGMSLDQIKISLSVDEGNEQVCVVAQDTGIGIAPEDLERIFEPLFTTKDLANHSGMGLFSVKRIINQHEGSIGVESEYGHGATFTICLPLRSMGLRQIQPNNEASIGQEG